MNTHTIYTTCTAFFNKLRRNELTYPWIASPKLSFAVIIGLGILNILIKRKILLFDLAFLAVGIILHWLLNYIHREFLTFYRLLEGKFVPPTIPLEQWFKQQTASIFGSWKGYVTGILFLVIIFIPPVGYLPFVDLYLFRYYIPSPAPLFHFSTSVFYSAIIFFITGVGIFTYLQLLAFLLKMNTLQVAQSVPIFFDQEINKLSSTFNKFIFGGSILYALLVLYCFIEFIQFDVYLYINIFGIFSFPAIWFWIISVGCSFLLYFIISQYALHNIFVKCKQHNLAQLSAQFHQSYKRYFSCSPQTPKEISEELTQIIQWRETIQQQPEWSGSIRAFRHISGFRILLNTVILIITIILISVTISEISKEVVSVEPFKISSTLQKKGYDGQIISNKLIDQLNYIVEGRNSQEQRLFGTWTQEEVHMEVPGVGFSLESMQQLLRQFIGKKTYTISGELMSPDGMEKLSLTIRLNGRPAENIQGQMENMDELFLQAAEYVLTTTQPYALALFKWSSERDANGFIEVLQEIIEPTANEYFFWGYVLSREKRYDEAIEKYQRSIECDPFNTFTYLLWGSALVKCGEYQEAITIFQKISRFDSNNSFIYIAWGEVLARQHNYQEALMKFRKVLEREPNDYGAYAKWGDLLIRQHQYQEAKAKFHRAIEVQPTYSWAYRQYAWRLATYPDELFRDGEKALSLAQQAIEVSNDKEDPFLLDALAAAYAELGRFDEAVKTLEDIKAKKKLNKEQEEHLAHYKRHEPWREGL